MTTGLISWISMFLLSTPAAPTKPPAQEGDVPLRAHILELRGIQWRADLIDGLEYLEQHDGIIVWKANAATLKRLVAAAADCRPASTAAGSAPGTTRVYYIASAERIAQVSGGETTSLAFKPIPGDVLTGMELDLKGVPCAGGDPCRRHDQGLGAGLRAAGDSSRVAEFPSKEDQSGRNAPGSGDASEDRERPLVDSGRGCDCGGSGSSPAVRCTLGTRSAARAGRGDRRRRRAGFGPLATGPNCCPVVGGLARPL